MIKTAINGFGRIGRLTFRELINNKNITVTAINDLAAPSMLAYLLKYDSIQGRLDAEISYTENSLIVNGKTIRVYSERDPKNLPWGEEEIDLVLECTGIFESKEKASMHLTAGAKKVLISAPSDKDVKTVVYNVNHNILNSQDRIISAASCTTNCLAPVAKVLNDNFGISSGQMSTIHAYTNSQPLMDTPDPKANFRKSRAAADSIVPYTTGAAKAIGLVIPELKGKLDGSSQRVPVHSGSLVELYVLLDKTVSADEINTAMKEASNDSLGYNDEQIVSADIIGIKFGSLFDATQTKVVTAGKSQLVKVASWYDNEMSFVAQMIRTAEYFGEL